MKDSKLSPEDYAAARLAARQASYELQSKAEEEGRPLAWFDELYERAEGERAAIPWADAAPRFKLAEWLAAYEGHKGSAMDIGCGLGDNACLISEAGWDVTAFDLSEIAIKWAKKRFSESGIKFHGADLFALPKEWLGAFDLVHETYNLQAMPQGRDYVRNAMVAISSLVAPRGTVLVITRAREATDAIEGPPWPLTREDLTTFEATGLTEVRFQEFYDQRDDPIRHFLVEYKRL